MGVSFYIFPKNYMTPDSRRFHSNFFGGGGGDGSALFYTLNGNKRQCLKRGQNIKSILYAAKCLSLAR